MEPKTVKIDNIYDEYKNKLEIARHPGMHVYLKVQGVSKFCMMRLKVFDKNNYL